MASTFIDYLNTAASTVSTATQSYSNAGGPNPLALFSNLYDTVEVRTNAAPPIKLNIRDLGGEPSPYTQYLQPTIIFSGPAGRYVYAPYGEAGENTGKIMSAGALIAIAAAGFMIGRLSKR